MKKILLPVLIIMILLTSCALSDTWTKDSRITSRVRKTYEKYDGYTCKANITTMTGEKESIYKIEETYIKPNKYRLEILEPRKSKGVIILNTDDKVSVEHPAIDQSISLVTVKSLNNQMLIGDFYERISRAKLIDREDINGEEHLVFEIRLKKRNKHRHTAKVWIRRRDYTPYKLSMFDRYGVLKVEIIYSKFKFNRNLIK